MQGPAGATQVDVAVHTALVVNNLGGTSNLKLSIVTNATIRYLSMPQLFVKHNLPTLSTAIQCTCHVCSAHSSSGPSAAAGVEGICWESDDLTANS